MTPIFQQAVVVSPAVQAEDDAILAAEGSYHVAGRYIPCASDADKVRRVEAERRVEGRAREASHAVICPWCNQPVKPGSAINLGGRNLHGACVDEFDTCAYGVVCQ